MLFPERFMTVLWLQKRNNSVLVQRIFVFFACGAVKLIVTLSCNYQHQISVNSPSWFSFRVLVGIWHFFGTLLFWGEIGDGFADLFFHEIESYGNLQPMADKQNHKISLYKIRLIESASPKASDINSPKINKQFGFRLIGVKDSSTNCSSFSVSLGRCVNITSEDCDDGPHATSG